MLAPGKASLLSAGANRTKNAMTPRTATRESRKFTSENRTRSSGKTHFLMRTFFRSDEASMIELMAPPVASVISVKSTVPRMR